MFKRRCSPYLPFKGSFSLLSSLSHSRLQQINSCIQQTHSGTRVSAASRTLCYLADFWYVASNGTQAHACAWKGICTIPSYRLTLRYLRKCTHAHIYIHMNPCKQTLIFGTLWRETSSSFQSHIRAKNGGRNRKISRWCKKGDTN